MNNIDLTHLEEQILDYLKESESNMLKLIESKNSEIVQNVNKLELKFNELSEKDEEIKEALVYSKIFKEKITEIETFRNKADDILISHELRIKDNIKDIFFLKDKYEKIISENLLVPGYIGNSCKFKNLSDFLVYNIIELNKVKTEKDDRKKEIKELKNKNENLMKSMISLNDGSIEQCKIFTNNIQKDIINYIDNKLKDYEKKFFDIKTEIYKSTSLNEQKNNDINNKCSEIKKELHNILNEKIDQIKNLHNSLGIKIEENSEKIKKNIQEIKNLKIYLDEISLKLKDNYLNLKNINLLLNNKFQSQIFEENTKNEIGSAKKNIQKSILNNNSNINRTSSKDITKNINKFINENKKNNSMNNQSKTVNYKSKNSYLKPIKDKTSDNSRKNKISKDHENDFDINNEKEDENFINSDTDNNDNINNNDIIDNIDNIDNFPNKSKNIHTSNSSFEKPIINKIYNNKAKHSSNNNLIVYKNEKNNIKYKNTSSDLNKYFKREEINAKSINTLKEERLSKEKEIRFYKYKSKENNNNYINSQKILRAPIINNIKSPSQEYNIIKEKEKFQERDKEINVQNEKKMKLKLNYELINNIHQNKVLDLYSFSISPPDGKINLKYWTLKNLQEKVLKKEKQNENEKESGNNYKLVQKGNKTNINIKPIKSQSNIKNERNKYQNHMTSDKIKYKNNKNNTSGMVYNAIIDIPPKFNFPFNKTFFENDYNKMNINNEGMKLRNTMKEFKLNENFYSLTYK